MPATRDDLTAFARSLDGLSANPDCPASRAKYLDLIAPGETPARAAEMATNSGCGLVMRAVLRNFIDHPILRASYRSQHALSDLVEIASQAGAAYTSRRDVEPSDIVIVGGGSDGGGPEHTYMVLSLDDCDPYADRDPCELITVGEGGQHDDKGFQAIHVRQHQLQRGHDSAEGSATRLVRWVFDVEKIVAKFGRA